MHSLCTENEVYHLDNVFFKIGEDEARLLFFHWYIRYCYRTQYFIGAFFIVSFSTGLEWRDQRVIARFSSSELSSYQIPRFFWLRGSTTAKGLYANSFFVLSHYAFGGVRAQALSVFVLSTSTTGSSRRVPPPRGSLLAPLLQGLPFSVFLSILYGTRLLLFPRVAADGSGWDPSSLRPDVRVLRRAYLCAGSTSTGAFGRVSRARLCTSSSFFS